MGQTKLWEVHTVKNMRVSKKLILSFLIVLVLSVLIGIFGIVGMYQMNAGDDRLYNENYLPTVLAGNISEYVVDQRTHVRNFIIFDATEASFQNSVAALNTIGAELSALLDEYDESITLEEDRKVFDEFKDVYNNEWLALLDAVESAGAANDQEGAEAILTDEHTKAVVTQLDGLTTELQNINMREGQRTVDANTTLFTTMSVLEIIILLVAAALAIFLALYISGMISKPLALLSAFMQKAGTTGDITLTPEDRNTIGQYGQIKDEIGQCIGATAAFVQHISTIAEKLGTIAGGDLSAEMKLLSDKDTMGLSLQKMVGNLNEMFREIHNSTAQVATGSKQIADGSQALAQGSTQQAASVEELSSSISEIAEKTHANADMASRAANLANTIKQNAEKGSHQMDEMMAAVQDINAASQNISKVIKTIDNIAFQTNILALNAAVEAARAGQHGKGFAVVAEEVRSLATKSADAARDTNDMIQNSIEKAELGSRIAGETAASLTEIVSGINESSQIVGDIARSSEEQSLGITQINKGIDQVAQVVQQNSATAEESAAAAEEMSSQSNMLEELISQFKLKDGNSNRRLGGGGHGHAPRKQIAMPEKTVYSADGNADFGKY